MAQFNHPERGGPGQWSQGGMTMIGDMFNDALKAKVSGLCSDLSRLLREGAKGNGNQVAPTTEHSVHAWWGADVGIVTASGAQNSIRYAYFSGTHRLPIQTDTDLTIYDTGDHEIGGVSQQQSSDASLSFMSQHGVVSVATLKVVQKND